MWSVFDHFECNHDKKYKTDFPCNSYTLLTGMKCCSIQEYWFKLKSRFQHQLNNTLTVPNTVQFERKRENPFWNTLIICFICAFSADVGAVVCFSAGSEQPEASQLKSNTTLSNVPAACKLRPHARSEPSHQWHHCSRQANSVFIALSETNPQSEAD